MQLASLSDGVALLARVNDEQSAGELLHLLDAAEVLLELGDLAFKLDDFLLGKHCEGAVLLHLAQLGKTVDTGAHGLEVGQHATEPTGVDIVLINSFRFFLDSVLRLLLGADKQDVLAVSREITDEVVGFLDLLYGLLQVNDINTIALRVDVGSHFRVPASGLMAEMDTSFEQAFHGYDYHLCVLLFVLTSTPFISPVHRSAGTGTEHPDVCGL